MAISGGLTISSLNVNGLGDNLKRKDVLDYLRQQKHNIYFLQETHIKVQSENCLRSVWGYNVLVAGCCTNKNGVAILFNNNFDYKIHRVNRDTNGCYIIVDIEILSKRVTLVNVYGPSYGDKREFFDKIGKLIEEFGNSCIIIGGDWNVVLDETLDTHRYKIAGNRPRSREKIKDIMAVFNLTDVWRDIHPGR